MNVISPGAALVNHSPPRQSVQRFGDWLRTIRFQVGLALGMLFLLLASSVGFTLYELDLRKHDYEILTLAGQLRVTSHAMTQQARNYLKDTPTDYEAYNRDLRLFYGDIKNNVALYDALTSKRPYKEAWPVERALALLDEESGHHFDPVVVAAFRRAMPRVMDVYDRHKHV